MAELPQELIDAIIDAIVSSLDLSEDPWIASSVFPTLRACSLVAHAFVRPCQQYIFHGITLSDDAGSFVSLLETSPHIASYIRALYVESALRGAEPTEIRQILELATNLVRLDISPEPSVGPVSVPWTQDFSTVYEDSLALASLRHVTLWYFTFDNARQLEELLSRSVGLKTLVLRSVRFSETATPTPAEETEVEPTVVLERLDLYFLDSGNVSALLEAFKRVDLTKLRSLYLHNTPMNSLLESNASTLEELRIRAYYPDMFLNDNVSADALAGASQLLTLDLKLPFLPSLSRMVRRFGSLEHLVQLHTVIVSVSQKTVPAEWTELDDQLGVLGGELKEVRIHSGSQWNNEEPHSDERMQTWMPVLAGRGVLRLLGHDAEADEFSY
ncbi:hypothetical protein C8F01DRAFT_1369727 [Mycena amicta]|nr:hypothetical protein C8F01DRAFT_1369727 [Mycena amicta]